MVLQYRRCTSALVLTPPAFYTVHLENSLLWAMLASYTGMHVRVKLTELEL